MQQTTTYLEHASSGKFPPKQFPETPGHRANGPVTQVAVIHIVDDDDEFRKAIARLLVALGYEVRCYQNAGDYLLADKQCDGPACLLLDYMMPGPSGLELQAALANSELKLPTIFLSGRADIGIAVDALKNGAQDFLVKPVDQEKLVNAIELAVGQYSTSHDNSKSAPYLHDRYVTLSEREKTVFEYVVSGKLNKEIAYQLKISERTVKAHRASVMQKMQANSLAELVYMAVHLGFTLPTATTPK